MQSLLYNQQVTPAGFTPHFNKPVQIDLSFLKPLEEKASRISAQNYLLGANALYYQQTNEIKNRFGTDPDATMKALEETTKTISEQLPVSIRENWLQSVQGENIKFINQAAKNKVIVQDNLLKENTAATYALLSDRLLGDTQDWFNDEFNPITERDPSIIKNMQRNQAELTMLTRVRDSGGKLVMSDSDIKQALNNQQLKLVAFKNVFQNQVNTDLDRATEYYQQTFSDSESFMKNHGLDRDTYDKMMSFAKQQLKDQGKKQDDLHYVNMYDATREALVDPTSDRYMELKNSGALSNDLFNKITTIQKFQPTGSGAETDFFMSVLFDSKDAVSDFMALRSPENLEDMAHKMTDTMIVFNDLAEKAGADADDVATARESLTTFLGSDRIAKEILNVQNMKSYLKDKWLLEDAPALREKFNTPERNIQAYTELVDKSTGKMPKKNSRMIKNATKVFLNNIVQLAQQGRESEIYDQFVDLNLYAMEVYDEYGTLGVDWNAYKRAKAKDEDYIIVKGNTKFKFWADLEGGHWEVVK